MNKTHTHALMPKRPHKKKNHKIIIHSSTHTHAHKRLLHTINIQMCSFNKTSDINAREVDLGSIANNKPPRFFINKTFLCVVKQIKIVSINSFCVYGVIYFVWLLF